MLALQHATVTASDTLRTLQLHVVLWDVMPYLWIKQLTSSVVVYTHSVALVRPQQGHVL
jgi:hypothetical protein